MNTAVRQKKSTTSVINSTCGVPQHDILCDDFRPKISHLMPLRYSDLSKMIIEFKNVQHMESNGLATAFSEHVDSEVAALLESIGIVKPTEIQVNFSCGII